MKHLLFAALAVVAVVSSASASVASAGGAPLRSYRVTIENLTGGQPLSPGVAATHRANAGIFGVGDLASPGIEAIAEDGNQIPARDALTGAPGVTSVAEIDRPLTPDGTTVGAFTDTFEFEIDARPGDRLSLATMLICTNDGFLGLDSVKLPDDDPQTFYVNGYDAGRENNTEISPHIVDPCSALGPAPLPGDPDGNLESGPGVTTDPAERIRHHPNIQGTGELSILKHSWTDPVAKVTVEPLDEND